MASKANNARDMTRGPVWQKLASLSGPMVLGILATMSISMVDTYFVGELGTEPLAALSFTFPVTFTILSLAIGLSAGSASVVSRTIGANNTEESKQISTDSIVLSFLTVLVLTVGGYFSIRPLFALIGAEGAVLEMIVRYMQIWFISMPFLVIPMVVNALIRAAGDAFWPSVIMIISSLVNITLTPAFINGWWGLPAMDIEGAAIATLIARILVFVMAGTLIIFKERMVTFKRRTISEIIESWQSIAKIAVPAAFGNAIYPLTTGVVTSILATYGNEAVAAYGAATRIEAFACIPMFALSSAIGPVCGQNWGAGNKDRVKTAQWQSYGACFAWSLLLFAAFVLFSDVIANQFSDDTKVAKFIGQYLSIVSITFWGYGVCIVAAGCFNAIGKPYTALCYYLLRCFVLYIPVCWVISIFYDDVSFIFVGIATANLISGSLIAFHGLRKAV